jgi:methanogenic corrinoid protein MtbC1
MNVAMLIKSGYKISMVALFSDEKIQSEIIRQNRFFVDPKKNIEQLLFHTVNLDIFKFEQLLNKIIQENGFSKTIQNVVFPFFNRVGFLWQAGTIFVAHEHFVSNLIRNRLIIETAKFDNNLSAKSILFFLPEGEFHELGLLYLNYLAAENGFKCVYIGQNLPFGDLANLLRSIEFNFICTSFIYAIGKPELEQYLFNLSMAFSKNKILVAGRQITIHKPKLPSNVVMIKNSNDFVRKIQVETLK